MVFFSVEQPEMIKPNTSIKTLYVADLRPKGLLTVIYYNKLFFVKHILQHPKIN